MAKRRKVGGTWEKVKRKLYSERRILKIFY
ncbi:uncharacterized protein G2W53_027543 [Senna tora]|uniref:Uncharacterized protein n=1 Tax=Senna tora TaxID=362788 RepID=A0A834TH46_9FABA|nr:uncharacterized protein G2W53_027543 [Senna tora]